MVFNVNSSTVFGITGVLVSVETSISNSLPGIKIVGLPDKYVDDAKERVLPAIKNTGINLNPQKITINLAPSYIPKKGSSLDLPIAISIIGSYGLINRRLIENTLIIGEISLNGNIRYTNGILQALEICQKNNYQNLIIPKVNSSDIPYIENLQTKLICCDNIREVIDFLNDIKNVNPYIPTPPLKYQNKYTFFNQIKGNENLKRILKICALGRHNLLMVGSPGCGKTLAAKALVDLLQPLSATDIYEVSLIYNSSNYRINNDILSGKPPFRSPHHTSSYVSIIGGGTNPQPGEISLAHNGVLFLDEFNEYSPKTLDSLREPLEEKSIKISRANYKVDYPSNFQLIAAMNPCPCGYFKDTNNKCICTNYEIQRYNKRISFVILDRIDILTYVSKPKIQYLNTSSNINDISDFLEAIKFKNSSGYKNNKILSEECNEILKQAYDKLNLSVRSYYKIIKISRTIADLNLHEEIQKDDLLEALSYRNDTLWLSF